MKTFVDKLVRLRSRRLGKEIVLRDVHRVAEGWVSQGTLYPRKFWKRDRTSVSEKSGQIAIAFPI